MHVENTARLCTCVEYRQLHMCRIETDAQRERRTRPFPSWLSFDTMMVEDVIVSAAQNVLEMFSGLFSSAS